MGRLTVLVVLAMALAFAGCATHVERVEVEETIDLSGRWNDTDSRLVSEEMIKDALDRAWLGDFMRKAGKKPVVIVGTVQNRSHEHINVQTFVKDLERALINSGEVEFVAGRTERDELREERKDQARYSSEETAKKFGEEVGADYMLKGTLNSIQDRVEGKAVVFYQVNLELMDMESNKKVWIGEKKIKKLVTRPKYGY